METIKLANLALRSLLELCALVVFGSAAAALHSAGRPTLAWVLLLVFVINRTLMYAWGQ